MRSKKSTYRKITRAAYLLSLIFLLSGLMLSLVSQPVQAGRPTPPVVRTPDGPVPTEVTPPPAHNPDNPGVPGRRVPGRNIQNFNFSGQAEAPGVPNPPIRLLLSTGSVRFTQSDYCLSQPGPGWVDATVIVNIPAGETAILSYNWYVVHPNPYPDHPDYNDIHYASKEVTNGEQVTWQAYWPGASLYNPGDPQYSTIEIHWGAQLIDPETQTAIDGGTASLDAFYSGRCDNRPALTVSHQCAVGGGIDWTVHNEGSSPVNFTYAITDGPTGNNTVASGGSLTFASSTGGAHTATVTYDNGQGVLVDATGSSAAGECQAIPALTVSHACGDNGVVFSASNPNNFQVAITYTDGTTTGSAMVPANGVVDFLTLPRGTTHDVSITWDNGIGGQGTASDHSSAEECGTVALVLSHQCKDGGGIIWSVYNPGTATVAFDWNLDSGQLTGSGSVSAGQTVIVTESSGGAHRLDLTWTGGSAFDTSTIEECGGPPNPVLTIGQQCIEGGGIQWTVTNTGNVATTFTWALDTDAATGSGSVGVGQTVNVTASTGGAHLLTVTYGGNSVSLQSGNQDCGGAGSLTITYVCAVEGGIQWRVTNSGATALAFDWNLDNDSQTGKGNVGANTTVDVVVSAGGTHSLSITWSGGSTTLSSTAEDCNPKPVTLGLRWQCSEDNTGVDWVVANNNAVEVTFTWRLDDSPTGTTDTIGPNATKIFHTVIGHDSHKMTISWSDQIGAYSLSDTNPGNVCGVPEEPVLTITDRCVLPDHIEWTVRNPGERAVEFDWVLDDNAQSGHDTAPAGSKVFLVTTGGRHSVTITWPQNNSFTHNTSATRCVPIITTPTEPPDGTTTPGTPGTGVTPGPSSTSNIPQTGGTPVPTLSAPGSPSSATSGQGAAVSPVTGIDLHAMSLATLVQRLFTNLGLLFLGVALVLTGFGSRIK